MSRETNESINNTSFGIEKKRKKGLFKANIIFLSEILLKNKISIFIGPNRELFILCYWSLMAEFSCFTSVPNAAVNVLEC